MSGLILPGDDVVRIADRVKHGDATIGWRGDPAMDVYLNDQTGRVQVFGYDGRGDQYIAAEVDPFSSQGWRHELLRKLKDGDWQDETLVDRRMAWMGEVQIEKDNKINERNEEGADRLAWALQRDLGHLYSGTTKRIH